MACSAAAAVVIAVNWATYIYGVTTDRVVETSLGYFINPLVTVLIGILILGERLRPLQWIALGVGIAAVVVLASTTAGCPGSRWFWRSRSAPTGCEEAAGVGAAEGLAVETAHPARRRRSAHRGCCPRAAGHVLRDGTGHALLLVSAASSPRSRSCCSARGHAVSMRLSACCSTSPRSCSSSCSGSCIFGEDMQLGRRLGFTLGLDRASRSSPSSSSGTTTDELPADPMESSASGRR